jgi:hypothetical protein
LDHTTLYRGTDSVQIVLLVNILRPIEMEEQIKSAKERVFACIEFASLYSCDHPIKSFHMKFCTKSVSTDFRFSVLEIICKYRILN